MRMLETRRRRRREEEMTSDHAPRQAY